MEGKKAVVLLSGGIDSATTLAFAKHHGFAVYALTVIYGQRHAVEENAARRVAASLGVEGHIVQRLDLRPFGGSALTSDLEVPKNRSDAEMGEGIPPTYVPARNAILLSLALAWAETLGAFDIFIGANSLDHAGYPDCRPDFLVAFTKLANLATKAGVEGVGRFQVRAPLLHMEKWDIILHGQSMGVDYSLTHSCYDPSPSGEPCNRCDSCKIRNDAFARIENAKQDLVNRYESGKTR